MIAGSRRLGHRGRAPADISRGIRELVEALERAMAAADRPAVCACTAGPARDRLVGHLDRMARVGARLEPAREALSWAAGEARVGAAGADRCGRYLSLRLRFRDRSRTRIGRRVLRAGGSWHELAVVVDTGSGPWRLVEASEAPRR